MRRVAYCVAFMLLTLFASAAQPEQGVTEWSTFLSFSSADTVWVIPVEKAQGAGDLTVDTMDCCIPGDMWQVEVSEPTEAGAKTVVGVGNGSTSDWSGEVTAHPFVRGTVTVTYAEGVDVFGAGMWVRLRYSKATGMNVGDPYQP